MKRDYTCYGVGLIFGCTVIGIADGNFNLIKVLSIAVGLVLIVGSRYGSFGKTKTALR